MKKYIIVISLLIFFKVANAQVENTDMVEVAAGSFSMGNASYPRESGTRTVNLSKFYISKNTITNAQFAQFVNQYASQTVKDGEYAGKPLFVADSWGIVNNNGTWAAAAGYELFPAIKVTWYGAGEFCKWSGGRLPTEAEWEYAAKGGPAIKAFTYSGSSTAATVAWFYDNSGQTNKAVGAKTPNSLGICDMSGNVYQWCSDWFGRYNDFGKSGDVDPKGPQDGVSRVIRGGYRSIGSADLHLTHRESISPDECYNFVGFRLVKDNLFTGLPIVNSQISIYPNPAFNNISINSDDEIRTVEIIDSEGRLLYKSLAPDKNISIAGYATGIYVVKVTSGANELIQKVLIKN
jgi:formylglycine-generating enzyme required for sulfatase activity